MQWYSGIILVILGVLFFFLLVAVAVSSEMRTTLRPCIAL